MVRDMKEVLKELGWTSGFNVPVANDENKRIEQEVEEVIKKKAELIIQLEVINDRDQTMKNHLTNINNEKTNNQELITTLKKQMESEKTALRLAEFEINKNGQEWRNMKKEMEKTNERDKHIEVEVERLVKKFDKLKEVVEWGEEALFAWEEELARGHRDADILHRFKFQDEDKYNQLQVKREQLMTDLLDIKSVEQNTCNKLDILEVQLEQTCKLFREIHGEREKLIDSWESIIKVIKARDDATYKLVHEKNKIKEKARRKYLELCEKRQFYEEQKNANDRLERGANKAKEKSIKDFNIGKQLEEAANELHFELSVSRNNLAELGVRLGSQRAENKRLTNEILRKESSRESLKAQKIELQSNLDLINVDWMTDEQRLQNAEDIYQMAVKQETRLRRDLDKLQLMVYKMTQEKKDFKAKLLDQTNLIESLKKDEKAIEEEIRRVAESYNEESQRTLSLEMELFKIGIKIMKLSQKENDLDIDAEQNERLERLENEIAETNNKCNIISEQIGVTKKALKISITAMAQGKDELATIEGRTTETQVVVRSSERELSAKTNAYREKVLLLNLARMQVDRARQDVAAQQNSVCKLESKRIELEMLMKERKLEIETQRELLNGKKKTLDENRICLKRTIDHLNTRIGQLEKRYEIVMNLLGKSDDGEQMSVTHFKIRSAQEKHELQEKGDELEAKINKTEEEILAMENTLRLVSLTNDNFKTNLDSVEDDSPEMLEHNALEKEYVIIIELLREKQKEWKLLNKEIRTLNNGLRLLETEEERLQDVWRQKDKEAYDLERDLANKQSKLDRAARYLAKLSKEIKRSNDPPTFKRLSQREIDVRMKGEQNQSCIHQLVEFGLNYPESGPVVRRYATERQLDLPQPQTAVRLSNIASSSSLRSAKSFLSIPSSQLGDDSSSTGGSVAGEGSRSHTPASTIYLDASILPERDSFSRSRTIPRAERILSASGKHVKRT